MSHDPSFSETSRIGSGVRRERPSKRITHLFRKPSTSSDDARPRDKKTKSSGTWGMNRSPRVSIEAHDVGVAGVTRDDGRVGFLVVGAVVAERVTTMGKLGRAQVREFGACDPSWVDTARARVRLERRGFSRA